MPSGFKEDAMDKLSEAEFGFFVAKHEWLLVESPETTSTKCKKKAVYLTPMGNLVNVWVDKSGNVTKIVG